MLLSDKQIKNAKPKEIVYRLRDKSAATKGLGVTIAPAGSKTFFLSYTSPASGKRKQVNLGVYPATSLKDARMKAMVMRERISLGIDPKEQIWHHGPPTHDPSRRRTGFQPGPLNDPLPLALVLLPVPGHARYGAAAVE